MIPQYGGKGLLRVGGVLGVEEGIVHRSVARSGVTVGYGEDFVLAHGTRHAGVAHVHSAAGRQARGDVVGSGDGIHEGGDGEGLLADTSLGEEVESREVGGGVAVDGGGLIRDCGKAILRVVSEALELKEQAIGVGSGHAEHDAVPRRQGDVAQGDHLALGACHEVAPGGGVMDRLCGRLGHITARAGSRARSGFGWVGGLAARGRSRDLHVTPAEALLVDLHPGMGVGTLDGGGLPGSHIGHEAHGVAGGDTQGAVEESSGGGVVTADALLVGAQEGQGHIGLAVQVLIIGQVIGGGVLDIGCHLLNDVGVVFVKALLLDDELHVGQGCLVDGQIAPLHVLRVGGVVGGEGAFRQGGVDVGGVGAVVEGIDLIVCAHCLDVAHLNLSQLRGGHDVVGDHANLHMGGDGDGIAREGGDLVHEVVGEVVGGVAQLVDGHAVHPRLVPALPVIVTEGLHFEVEGITHLGVDLHDGKLGGHTCGQSPCAHARQSVHACQEVGQLLGVIGNISPLGGEGFPFLGEGIPFLGQGGPLKVGVGLQRRREGGPLEIALPLGEGDVGEVGVKGAGMIGVAGEVPRVDGVENVSDIQTSLGEEGAEVGSLLAFLGDAPLGHGAANDGYAQYEG